MITIGIPKGLFYFEHHVLWEQFFKNLGCNVIVSDDTNKQILDLGVKHCSNETCLPVKVFHGHVLDLKDKADYIFIPRYESLDSNEFTCPKFCGLPDMTLLNLKRQINVIEVVICLGTSASKTLESIKKAAVMLNVDKNKALFAFKDAVKDYEKDQQAKLGSSGYSASQSIDKPAISILGHPYMLYDSYLSMRLFEKLRKRNISVYTPRDLKHETKRENAYPFQGKAFWEIGFELLGSAFAFAQDLNIRGVIYLTPFACGLDAFILEFIERKFKSSFYSLPLLKLTVDEHTGEAGFDTRLEAFLDMVG